MTNNLLGKGHFSSQVKEASDAPEVFSLSSKKSVVEFAMAA